MSNVQMRIVHNFGEEYGLKAVINDSGGITFKMKVPIINLEGEKIEYCNCR